MIKRIELKNFMSHKKTVIEPSSGLTVLIGPNNVGKSAVIAALQILCYNDNSTFVIRHGTKSCAVTVETTDGHVIKWQRKGSPSYEIDGQRFDRLGVGGTPDELHQVLRLQRVKEHGNDEFDVHFGTQKSPIFLLDSSGAAAARFFASSSDAIRLVEMQKRHQDNVRNTKAEQNRLKKESDKVNAELAALEAVTELDQQVEALQATRDEIVEQEVQNSELTERINELVEKSHLVTRFDRQSKILDDLSTPPIIEPTQPLEDQLSELQFTQSRFRHTSDQLAALEDLQSVPVFAETQSLDVLQNDLRSYQIDIDYRSCMADVLDDLVSPPSFEPTETLTDLVQQLLRVIDDHKRFLIEQKTLDSLTPFDQETVAPLQSLVSEWEESVQRCRRFQDQWDLLSRLRDVPEMQETHDLDLLVNQIVSAESHMLERQEEFNRTTNELAVVVQELKDVADESTCPLCGGEIDVDCLIQSSEVRGHTHG